MKLLKDPVLSVYFLLISKILKIYFIFLVGLKIKRWHICHGEKYNKCIKLYLSLSLGWCYDICMWI